MLTGPVLAATDLRAGGDEALRQADALARALGAPLHVCHILPEALRVRMLFPQLQQRDATEMQELERKAGEAVVARVEAVTRRRRGEYRLATDSGSPSSGILLCAEKVRPGVLVLGAGRVALQVVRHAACPVLVARPSPSGKVLGATDLSDPSLPAVSAAVDEASRRGAKACLAHCIDLTYVEAGPTPMGFPLPPIPDSALEEIREDARRRLQASLASLGATGEILILDGSAALSILHAARELPAQLVVVGTRGRTGLSRLALGSVAEAILADAPCSVLVVRLHES